MQTSKKPYIILTDDDLDDLLLFQIALKDISKDYTLAYFQNGQLLLDHLKETDHLPHCLFLDQNMPIKGGLETLQEIRREPRFASLPIAIYSTSNEKASITNTLANGANLYITKPSDIKQLKELLQQILDIDWQCPATGAFDGLEQNVVLPGMDSLSGLMNQRVAFA
ncbi:response regulator [Flavobacterium sp. PLA-1-15]|uniref:response regulator n=1 Tax=Flavobacterium sp. PLA-1-15 TaxID=3380533 RepID=UPI003B7ED93A